MASYTAATSFHYVDPYKERPTEGDEDGRKQRAWARCLQRLVQRRHFDDARTEALYARYMRPHDVSSVRCVIVVLLVILTGLATLGFVYDTHVTARAVTYVTLCVVLLTLLVIVHTPFARKPRLFLVVMATLFVVLASYVIVSLPFAAQHHDNNGWVRGVWEATVVVLAVYALLPCQLVVAIATGVLLPSAQVTVCLLRTPVYDWHFWQQVSANVIIFFAINVVGVYLHEMIDKTSRKLFLNVRASIASRLCLEDENDKLERLLTCSLPTFLATEMKEGVRLRQSHGIFHKSYTQSQPSASILVAELCGVSSLTSQGICSAEEFVRILNELFAKFDQLSTERHCLRVHFVNDGYFCISGIPDSRPDHVKCCLEMALDMIDVVTIIRDVTDVDLGLRIGLHTGRLHTAIMGLKRWAFDAWSDDVCLAQQIAVTAEPMRVHISRAALDHLHGEYVVEMNSAAKELRDKGVETYTIVSAHPRRFQEFLSLRGIGRSNPKTAGQDVLKVLAAMQSRAEIPFAYALQDMADHKRQTSNVINHYVNEPKPAKGSEEDRVQRRLEQMVYARALDKVKADHVNFITLRFHKASRERQFQRMDDTSFVVCILLCLILLVLAAGFHALILPRRQLLAILSLFTFSWIATLLVLCLGVRLKCLRCVLLESPPIKTVLMLITISLTFATCFISSLFCDEGVFKTVTTATTSTTTTSAPAPSTSDYLQCGEPQYIYLGLLLPLLVVMCFARTSSLLKSLLMLAMTAGYVTMVEVAHGSIFANVGLIPKAAILSHISAMVCMVASVVVLIIHSRTIDWLFRLCCIWIDQMTQERDEVNDAQCTAQQILVNAITPSVTNVLMEHVNNGQLELYSKSYSLVGVVYASIPQFVDVYKHQANNGRGDECIRSLNRIIGQFDELLDKEKFHCLEKIKTCGNIYVVAVGLANDDSMMDTRDGLTRDLATLVDFVFAMKDKLQHINDTSSTHYKLRAGMDVGNVTAGVVGGRRPQFDLWGQCVTLASRLEVTSLPDQLQVTELVHDILQEQYVFHTRSSPLRSNRDMRTYFLTAKRHLTDTSPQQPAYGGGLAFNARSESVTAGNAGFPVSAYRTSSAQNYALFDRQPSFSERTPLVQPIMGNAQQTTPPTSRGQRMQEPQPGQLRVNATPPGSMGQRRRHGDGSGGDQSARKPSGGTPSQLQISYMQHSPLTIERVESPDLPLVHYAKGISPAAPYQRQSNRSSDGPSPLVINTLTQSQLSGTVSPFQAQQSRPPRGSLGSQSSAGGGNVNDGGLAVGETAIDGDLLGTINRSIAAIRIPTTTALPPKPYATAQLPYSGSNLTSAPYSNAFKIPTAEDNFAQKPRDGRRSNTYQEALDPRKTGGLLDDEATNNMRNGDDDSAAKHLAENGQKNQVPPVYSQPQRRNNHPSGIPRFSSPHSGAGDRRVSAPSASAAQQQQHASPAGSRIPVASSASSNAAKTSPSSAATRSSGVPQLIHQQSMPNTRIPSATSRNVPLSGLRSQSFAEGKSAANGGLRDVDIQADDIKVEGHNDSNGLEGRSPAADETSGALAKADTACSTDDADHDVTSHGTQTSLPRLPPKQRLLRPNAPDHHSPADSGTAAAAAADAPSSSTAAGGKTRPPAPPFQVKRRQRVRMPTRRYRSLDYIPSDVDDGASVMSSRAESPRDEVELLAEREAEEGLGFDAEAFRSISSMIRRQLMPDNVSLSSLSMSSDVSKSDTNLNYDSGSAAYESEYDNYRAGMASDDDYFVPDPVSDADADMFDDIDVENVMVSDKFTLDIPPSFLPKRTTQV